VSQKARITVSLLLCLALSVALTTPVAGQFDPVGEVLRPADSNNFTSVAEKDGYVYVGTSGGIFYIFDARTVSLDGPFRTINAEVSKQDLSVRALLRIGNKLYVAGDGLLVMDVTNPAAPVAGIKMLTGVPRYMSNSGDYLFATGPNSLVVYSLSDPSSPAIVAETTLGGDSGYSVARLGENIYVGVIRSGQYFLRVFSWPGQAATILPVREIGLSDVPYHLIVNGDYLASSWGNTTIIWSLADPSSPAQVDEETTGGRAALLWGDKLVTNGRVHSWHGPLLDLFSAYAPGGGQSDGVPHGAAGNADFVFIAQSARILILATPPTLLFPQYVNGQYGGLANRTRLILRNSGTATVTGLARFRTSAGAANPVPIGGTNHSEVEYSIPAGGTYQVTTGGTGTLTVGPLELRSDTVGDTAIRGTEIFDLLGYSVSVQNAPLAKVHTAFVSRTGSENTGVAMYNPSFDVSFQIEARLFNKNGVQVAGPVTLTLAPRHQTAVFLTDAALFQAFMAGAGDFEGTLKLTVTAGGPISVVSLLQKSNGALLAVPVESQTPPGP
jgi:hypothetical protein